MRSILCLIGLHRWRLKVGSFIVRYCIRYKCKLKQIKLGKVWKNLPKWRAW